MIPHESLLAALIVSSEFLNVRLYYTGCGPILASSEDQLCSHVADEQRWCRLVSVLSGYL